MRKLARVLVAAAVGIDCGAPAGAPDAIEPAGVGPDEVGSTPRPPAPPSDGPAAPGPRETSLLDLSAMVRGGAAPQVVSTVTDGRGATYATGTFVGQVAIGDAVIRSRGDKDVFLVKLTPQGAFDWVRAVGSVALESSPRVTLEDDNRVTILGMTKGEMDCGSGPLNTWDSSTFFVCIFGADGATVTGGVFPTGNL